MKYGIKITGCFFIALSIFSCTRQPAKPHAYVNHSIAFYNVENLFDTEDDPAIDDSDFLPGGDLKWTQERYQHKLSQLSSVIAELGDSDGPELLGVSEIENRRVLEDLIATPLLSDRGYDIVHFDSPDRRGIDVALLYKKNIFTPVLQQTYPVTLPDTSARTRDILFVKGLIGKDTVMVLVNHWPSRRGGSEASEKNRVSAALVARQVVQEQLNLNPEAKIILLGDFNDEPTDISISEVLKAGKTKPVTSSDSLYNTVADLHAMEKGSYFYNSQYDMIDQIILTKGMLQGGDTEYVNGSAAIYQPERIRETEGKYAGAPLRTYAGKKYLAGFSDHFPVYIQIRVVQK